jgi:hypothetical protein
MKRKKINTLKDKPSCIKKCPTGYIYYAAKLLFQYRVVDSVTKTNNKKRPCSAITILFYAKNPKDAIRIAKSKGRKKEVSYHNTDNNCVHYEFVGIAEMLNISLIVDLDEIWIWYGELLTPMERKNKFILTDKEIMERIGKS